VNSEGNEQYVTYLLANVKNLLGEETPLIKNDRLRKGLEIQIEQLSNEIEDNIEIDGFTAFEIKEKLTNFVKALKVEGKDLVQIRHH